MNLEIIENFFFVVLGFELMFSGCSTTWDLLPAQIFLILLVIENIKISYYDCGMNFPPSYVESLSVLLHV
jgi:hypothetical protein